MKIQHYGAKVYYVIVFPHMTDLYRTITHELSKETQCKYTHAACLFINPTGIEKRQLPYKSIGPHSCQNAFFLICVTLFVRSLYFLVLYCNLMTKNCITYLNKPKVAQLLKTASLTW